MYWDFFNNFDSTSIAIRYCYVLRFLFLTLDHGKKLNDTLHIQIVTIKKTVTIYTIAIYTIVTIIIAVTIAICYYSLLWFLLAY